MRFSTFLAEAALGDCFQFANKKAMEMLKDGILKEVFVCHGTISTTDGEFPHAWVEAEVNGAWRCFDWQMAMARTHSITRDDFYAHYRPAGVRRYRPAEAAANMIRHKHHGPWGEE